MYFERIDDNIDMSSISKDNIIEMNKQMGKTLSVIKTSIKADKCLYCQRKVDSFCKSHYVPKYCLKNISTTGEVTGFNAILGLPNTGHALTKVTPGINESGIFSIICNNCDNTIFHDYENPNNYSLGLTPTPKMLAQIAIKNYLKFIYKRKMEIAMTVTTIQRYYREGINDPFLFKRAQSRLNPYKMDLEAYTQKFLAAKKFNDTGKGDGFYLMYYRLLNYVVPIAIQAPIAVIIDLENNVVNDVFNMNPQYVPADLHLCVFPQESTTAIILFTDFGDRRYSKFMRQFRKLNDVDQLGVINFLIFLYCEDYFLSEGIKNKVDLKQFNEIANLTPVIVDTKPIHDTKVLADRFSLKNWNSIPNLLEEKNKCR